MWDFECFWKFSEDENNLLHLSIGKYELGTNFVERSENAIRPSNITIDISLQQIQNLTTAGDYKLKINCKNDISQFQIFPDPIIRIEYPIEKVNIELGKLIPTFNHKIPEILSESVNQIEESLNFPTPNANNSSEVQRLIQKTSDNLQFEINIPKGTNVKFDVTIFWRRI